jgi:hypothetical protein
MCVCVCMCMYLARFIVLTGIAGFAFGFPSTIMIHKLSAMWLCVTACVLCTIGHLLLWSSIKANTFYVGKEYLLAMYAFVAGKYIYIYCDITSTSHLGHGLSYMYHITLTVNLVNASKANSGKVFG